VTAEHVTVDDLRFELRRSPRRRSVQVTVDRHGELLLYAPDDCPVATMEDFVREKRTWIYTKLAEKEALLPKAPPKQYVSGESFPYLGRTYRLLLVDDDSQDVPVKLERGRFRMRRGDAPEGRRHMVAWYTRHALPWLQRLVQRLERRVGASPTVIAVQDLGYRWGSCSSTGRVNFHWRTILMPPPLVEYVVAHELVHLLEPHHTERFWLHVERVIPDMRQRRGQLRRERPSNLV
jgi:hypothetical protein